MLGASAWLVVVLSLVAANMPFLTERLLLVGPRRSPKSMAWRLLELLLLWTVVMLLGMALEARIGQRHTQGWEFYAVFGSLFLTFAFPGFVWRYLRKSAPHREARAQHPEL